MDIADMPGAVREAARVLEPGGRFCVCVTRPFADAGGFDGKEWAGLYCVCLDAATGWGYDEWHSSIDIGVFGAYCCSWPR